MPSSRTPAAIRTRGRVSNWPSTSQAPSPASRPKKPRAASGRRSASIENGLLDEVALRVAIELAEPPRLERQGAQHQARGYQRQVVDDVLGADHALRELLEVV